MALNKFIPLSPDPNITRDSDMGMAQFGHLNTIVDYLNGTNALGDLKLDGTLFFNSYSGGVASIIITHSGYNQNPLTYIGGGATLIVGGYYSQYLSTPYNQGYGNTVLGIYASIIAHDNSYFNTVVGYAASVTINEPGNVVIGKSATSSVANAVVIGRNANVSAYEASAIGYGAVTTTPSAVALGNGNSKIQIGGNFVPTARVHVKGLGATSATTSLLVQNSSGTNLISTTDDGETKISGVTKVGLNTATVVANAGLIASAANHYFYVKSNSNLDGEIGFKRNSGEDGIYTLQFDNAQAYIRYDRGAQTMATRCQFFITYITQGVERGRWQDTGEFSIGTTTKVPSSICTIESTNKGFLKPRLTTAQKNAIVTPAAGLEIYDTDLNRPCFYNGSAWVTL